MMCFRDMTFCEFYKDCAKANECHRPLTPKVKKDAEKWAFKFFKDGMAPIAVFLDKPDCHEIALAEAKK